VRKFFQLFFSTVTVSLIATTAFGQYDGAIKPEAEIAKGFNTITEKQSEAWVGLLAGENFKGRGTGQPGYLKASFFVAGKLAEYGFEPIGDNGTYFQNLPFSKMVPDPARSSMTIGDAKVMGEEIAFTTFGGDANPSGKIAFVKGVGASARLGDPADFRGRIIVMTAKEAVALQRDIFRARPLALITVVGDDQSIENGSVVNRGGGRPRSTVNATIKVSTAKKLAKAAGVDESFVTISDKDLGAISKQSEAEASIELKVIDKPIQNPNVVGWFEGSDPKLKHEHIIIGAHLDHLGENTNGLFPGADDNASGSTAILQIAKALSKNKVRPKRSVLMIWFAAEEIGLVGSKHYANNPLMPIKDCICMLNIDMIGRNEEKADEPASENEDSIHLIGTKKITPQMHELMMDANKYVGYRFEYDEEDTVFRRSDQASFHDKKIPVAFVFGGFNPFYHQTTDNIDGINFSKIANCARLYYAATFMAADHGHYSQRD
jgi:hypothetical protein